MKICSISGVPLIIQTKIFDRYASGLNFDIEPKVTTNPSGIDINKVSAKIKIFVQKPCNNIIVTSKNCSIYLYTKHKSSSPHFLAISAKVPSSFSSNNASLIFSVVSESFLAPIPYSSLANSNPSTIIKSSAIPFSV